MFSDGVETPTAPPELSIVMPCLDEADTVATCIKNARQTLSKHGIIGEVTVADNSSQDGSPHIAVELGARVIQVSTKGYGSALIGGIAAAHGQYVVIGDADDRYDFTVLTPCLAKLREGYNLVTDNRFKDEIKAGTMPPLHRYLGNPVLTRIGRLFFHALCGDFHGGIMGSANPLSNVWACGQRAWNSPVRRSLKRTCTTCGLLRYQ